MTTQSHSRDHTDDEMLDIEETADYLRVPVATLRYWRYRGTGPHSFKLMRHVRYWRSDLTHWLNQQTNHPQDEH